MIAEKPTDKQTSEREIAGKREKINFIFWREFFPGKNCIEILLSEQQISWQFSWIPNLQDESDEDNANDDEQCKCDSSSSPISKIKYVCKS